MRSKIRPAIVMIGLVAILSSGCAGIMDRIKEAVKTSGDDIVQPFDRERSARKVEQKLPNGMTVIVEENFGAPVVAVQIWVKAGSADETAKEAGIAHVIEHMMFKGTKKRKVVGQTAMEVESLGGDLNAFTSYDNTVYHITLASRFFGRALDILSDMVMNPLFDTGELNREREVVLEEIRMGQDNPRSRIWKYMFAEAYQVHPYGRPVIGFKETVSGFTREDILRFYHRYYTSSNMTVVVTGDVRAEDVIKQVENSLGGLPPSEAPAMSERPRANKEPEQEAARVKVYREDVNDGYLYLGYHIPEFKSADMPVLDVLSAIVGGGETSRLTYRVRTERQLVNNVYAYAYTPRDAGMFMVGADLIEEKAPQAVEMILKQIYLLKHEPVEDWELEKAKLSLESDGIYAKETVDGQARRIGYFYGYTGDIDYEKIYLEKIRAVTRDDIIRVAKQYFTSPNLSVVMILPEYDTPKRKRGKSSGLLDDAQVTAIANEAAKWDATTAPAGLSEPDPISPPQVPVRESTPEVKAGEPSALNPVKFTLANGIKLIVRENHNVPLISVRAVFEGGVRREDSSDNGINNFISETVTEGSAHYSAAEIHSFIESRASSVSGFTTPNSMGVELEVPSAFFRSCLPLFADIVRYPTFPDEEVERKRAIIIPNIRSQLDQPMSLAVRLLKAELFHEHPYGMDMKGTEDSVENITRDNLIDYYRAMAVPANLVIAVVGDVNAEEVRAQMDSMFRDWRGEPYQPEQVTLEAAPAEPREVSECKDVNQTNILIGFQGASILDEDRYPLEVLSSVLSGMSGRLFTTLRGKQSLAYSVTARSQFGVDPGLFFVYIGTAPDKEKAARDGIMKELAAIRDKQITSDELKRAKEVLIGDFEISLQRYSNQAAMYSSDELYGLGFRASERYSEKISAVTAQDVQRVARKYLNIAAPVTAVVRPCTEDAPSDDSTSSGDNPSMTGM